MKALVQQIHQTGKQVVIALTGGGSEAISELLRYGGGSTTLLEAVIPYNQKAFDVFVKGKPDKYCSPDASRDLAMAAFCRGLTYVDARQNVIGIGITASLAKDNERPGRDHIAYIAVQTDDETSSYMVRFDENREKEENLLASLILRILGKHCGEINGYDQLVEEALQNTTYGKKLTNLLAGKEDIIIEYGWTPAKGDIIFSGSFNPLHIQHKNMASKIFELTGKKVNLEICIKNVDKPALNYFDISQRCQQFHDLKENWFGSLYLTTASTFAQKSAIFPNSQFLIGFDTFIRINDPKYGNLTGIYNQLQENGATFLVFHRIINGQSTENSSHLIHPGILKISTIFDTKVLTPVDISSTKIRQSLS